MNIKELIKDQATGLEEIYFNNERFWLDDFHLLKDWRTQSLISLIRSEIERKKILKKKTIINMLQDDDVFDNNGLDGIYGYNTAIAEDIAYWQQVLLDLEK